MVARAVRDRKVGGSNPLAPTIPPKGLFTIRLPKLGKINIEDLSESYTLTDFVILVIAALLLLLCWRFLKRWNGKKAFGFWFPTLMVIACSVMVWSTDHVDSRTTFGSILIGIGFFIAGINFPFVSVAAIFLIALNALCHERLPAWILVILGVALFWSFWHLVLRFMRTRTLEKTQLSLNLKGKSLSP